MGEEIWQTRDEQAVRVGNASESILAGLKIVDLRNLEVNRIEGYVEIRQAGTGVLYCGRSEGHQTLTDALGYIADMEETARKRLH